MYAQAHAQGESESIQELQAHKKAIRDAPAAEVAAIRKATAAKVNALKTSERRLRALDIREQKRRDNHAEDPYWRGHASPENISDTSAAIFKGRSKGIYADVAERLQNALYGLPLVLKESSSDVEQD